MKRQHWYKVASGLILLGVVLMCQPFLVELYSAGFPVILLGVVLFNVLDHLPERRPHSDPPS